MRQREFSRWEYATPVVAVLLALAVGWGWYSMVKARFRGRPQVQEPAFRLEMPRNGPAGLRGDR